MEVRFFYRPDDEGEVERERAQTPDQFGTGGDRNFQVHRRVLLPEAPHDVRQHVQAGCVDHADAEQSAVAAAVGIQAMGERLGQRQHRPGKLDRLLTGRGGPAPAPGTLEQRHAQPSFELGDRLRQRRLADVQRVGRSAQAALACHLAQVRKLLQVQVRGSTHKQSLFHK